MLAYQVEELRWKIHESDFAGCGNQAAPIPLLALAHREGKGFLCLTFWLGSCLGQVSLGHVFSPPGEIKFPESLTGKWELEVYYLWWFTTLFEGMCMSVVGGCLDTSHERILTVYILHVYEVL